MTSNLIHLLVLDTDQQVIANSMQLIAGRTTQAYNRRKRRQGVFWEDRYHATAVQRDHHLLRCIAYIDTNMVRARVVNHPGEWLASGYSELQQHPKHYAIIDIPVLMSLLEFNDLPALQQARVEWVETLLCGHDTEREPIWSDCIAVGS